MLEARVHERQPHRTLIAQPDGEGRLTSASPTARFMAH
jgi:hypothetical protein